MKTFRFLGSLLRQRSRTPRCPEEPRLDGRRALVTGGSRGIGYEICRGLLDRGAEVLFTGRSEARAQEACDAFEHREAGTARWVNLDQADLDDVVRGCDSILQILGGRPLDVLVLNAAVYPEPGAVSAQGHELAFAVNVLAPHVLMRRLLAAGALRRGARVVFLVGDPARACRDCEVELGARVRRPAPFAYWRSKLGNFWQAGELQRRHPELQVVTVHPGFVRTGLVSSGWDPLVGPIRKRLLIDAELGAQTPLRGATQPDVNTGSYLHNVLGKVRLDPREPAAREGDAWALWQVLEELAEGWLPKGG